MKGIVEKYTVNKDKNDIEFFETTIDMKINVNAAMQGIITITKDCDLSEHLKSCAVDNKIYFFTKEKYI